MNGGLLRPNPAILFSSLLFSSLLFFSSFRSSLLTLLALSAFFEGCASPVTSVVNLFLSTFSNRSPTPQPRHFDSRQIICCYAGRKATRHRPTLRFILAIRKPKLHFILPPVEISPIIPSCGTGTPACALGIAGTPRNNLKLRVYPEPRRVPPPLRILQRVGSYGVTPPTFRSKFFSASPACPERFMRRAPLR